MLLRARVRQPGGPDTRSFALADPRGFLAQFREGVVLDEVQRAPDLFSYIQTLVDDDKRPGRFVLSGSQNFLLLRSIGQSLAGRSAVLHSLPLSLSELARRPTVDPDRLEVELLRDRAIWDGALSETLFRGFYPRLHDTNIGREADLYFWRTSAGREIDFLIERAQELVAIEAKSGQTIASDFFSGLAYWRELHGNPDWPALLITGGDRTYRRQGVDVISWRHL